MTQYKNNTVCVIDNGFFVHLAENLTKYFGTVLYYAPWVSSLPEMERADIGKGLPGVERILTVFDRIDKIDLFVFPDLYYSDLQKYLRSIGKRVWGTGDAEWLETDRWRSRQKMMDLKMPVPKTIPVKGLDSLREVLERQKDVFVKPSFWRGVGETFHHEDMFMTEPLLEEMEHRLGVRKTDIDFIVEKNIGEAVEIGYDGYVIDGKYPAKAFYGYEVKDCGYIGRFTDYSAMPKQIRYVNDKLAPVFAQSKSRGFVSNELRILPTGVPYLIDPTIRMGAPPGEVYVQGYENLGEILWMGAEGTLVTPQCKYSYGALAVIYSKYADNDWIAIEVPKESREFVKFKNHMMANGKDYVVPLKIGLNEIGSVVGFGNSVKEAIEDVKKNSEGVRGHGLEITIDSLNDATDTIAKGKKFGIEF